MKNIYRALKPLKNRMHLNRAVKCLSAAFIAGGAACVVLSLTSIFTEVVYLPQKIVCIYSVVFLAAILCALTLRPRSLKVVMTADSFGAKERFITAYELKNENTYVALLQRDDTYNTASGMDFKKLYPVHFPFVGLLAGILLLFILAGTFFIPTQTRVRAAEKQRFKAAVEELGRNIAEEGMEPVEMISKYGILSGDMKKVLRELQNRLASSGSKDEAVKALLEAKNKIKQLADKTNNDDLAVLAESLSKNVLTKDLSNALVKGNPDSVKSELEKLKGRLDTIDTKERGNLSKLIKDAASNAEKGGELADTLSSLGDMLASGNSTAAKEQISKLGKSISDLSEAKRQKGKQLDKLMASIDNARNSLEKQQKGDGGNPEKSGEGLTADESESGRQQPGDSSGIGMEPSSPESQDKSRYDQMLAAMAAGDSDNKEVTAGKIINGTANETQNSDEGRINPGQMYTGQDSGGNGNGTGASATGNPGKAAGNGSKDIGGVPVTTGEKAVKNFDSVYVPERLGGNSSESQVKGQSGSSGQSSIIKPDKTGKVEIGTALPYDKVLGNYESNAMKYIQRDSIPEGLKQIVRNYFTSLE